MRLWRTTHNENEFPEEPKRGSKGQSPLSGGGGSRCPLENFSFFSPAAEGGRREENLILMESLKSIGGGPISSNVIILVFYKSILGTVNVQETSLIYSKFFIADS
jgi:hypothetical protein